MKIEGKVGIVTGAASGIGEAVSLELAKQGIRALILVDRSPRVKEVSASINQQTGRPVTEVEVGDTTDETFCTQVFEKIHAKQGVVNILVPAAGVTRDALSVRINKETGKAEIYPSKTFREVLEINMVAPTYWALRVVAQIAEDRFHRGLGRWEPIEEIQGTIVFIGSVSSLGNKGQIAYAATKAGLQGVASTLVKEAMFHGVRCCVIHPGFTDTPMVRALGKDYLDKNILPSTQLRRLIRPYEIAEAICFMISNAAVSGELWADAGWHPSA